MMKPCNNHLEFAAVSMEVYESRKIEGRRMDADVGAVESSNRTVDGSEMQLFGWENVIELQETIENQII